MIQQTSHIKKHSKFVLLKVNDTTDIKTAVKYCWDKKHSNFGKFKLKFCG